MIAAKNTEMCEDCVWWLDNGDGTQRLCDCTDEQVSEDYLSALIQFTFTSLCIIFILQLSGMLYNDLILLFLSKSYLHPYFVIGSMNIFVAILAKLPDFSRFFRFSLVKSLTFCRFFQTHSCY